MESKKSFNIGDMFMSWKVIAPVPNKKYRYLCRCIECKSEKEFLKYNLLNGMYSHCKKCAPNFIKNIPEIRKHWNTELNGVVFTKPQDFDLSKSYWFLCSSGHNYKSSIKYFSETECPQCSEKVFDSNIKDLTFEYFKLLLKSMYNPVTILEYYTIVVPATNKVYRLLESNRYSDHFLYFKNQSEAIKELDHISKSNKQLKDEGYEIIQIFVEDKILKNVDTIEKIMLI